MDFQTNVLELTKQIPKGKITTYKAIAEALGTKAYRAVGTALKNNKTPILIPCHRVINSNGSIGNYSGGIKKKIELLRNEGIEIKDNKIDMNKYLFDFSRKYKKVVAFGTFDILHPGHNYFLENAAKFGRELVVVVARDVTVKNVKGRFPIHNEKQRMKSVLDTQIASKVLLGNLGDKYAILEQETPDIIALGYDQATFVDGLETELKKRKLHAKIVRLSAFKPELYKTSKIMNEMKQGVVNKNHNS